MTERGRNPTWEEVREELHAEDPELKAAYEASEAAYLVASELVRVRAEEGLSQSELARRMGTAQSVISRLERMETTPNLRTVFEVAKALGRRLEIRFVREYEAEQEDEGGPLGQYYRHVPAGRRIVPPPPLPMSQPNIFINLTGSEIRDLLKEVISGSRVHGGSSVTFNADVVPHNEFREEEEPVEESVLDAAAPRAL